MKRVLFIAYDINPAFGSECGVAHTYLKTYLKHFYVDIYTFSIHEPYLRKFAYGENANFHYVGFTHIDRVLWNLKLDIISNWLFCKRAGRLIAKSNPRKYEFMHIVTPAGYFAFNNLYKLGIKYIVGPVNGGLKTPNNFKKVFYKDTLHDFLRDLAYKLVIKIPGWRKYYIGATRVIISDKHLLRVLPLMCHKNTFQIFDSIIDPTEFKPASPRLASKTTVNLLYSGRLIPRKGIQLLLDAYKICVNEFKTDDLILNIAGQGPLSECVMTFIAENHFEKRISVLGNLPKYDMIREYQKADFYCLPTLREPGGMAILEAMSCSLPVITSNYGGPAFSVTPECGIKIEVNSYNQYVTDLAKAIHGLYENPDLRSIMGMKARERIINEFSIVSLETKLVRLWNDMDQNIIMN